MSLATLHIDLTFEGKPLPKAPFFFGAGGRVVVLHYTKECNDPTTGRDKAG